MAKSDSVSSGSVEPLIYLFQWIVVTYVGLKYKNTYVDPCLWGVLLRNEMSSSQWVSILVGYFLEVDGWDSYNFCDSEYKDSPFFSTDIRKNILSMLFNLI